jgi:hypothetical protein
VLPPILGKHVQAFTIERRLLGQTIVASLAGFRL